MRELAILGDDARSSTEVTHEYVHAGPKTLGGRYLRRFWQPVATSAAVARGATAPIRAFGEEFTLYRADDGTAHVVAPRCPHRGTRLSTASVEPSGLRCVYHGWAFDAAGQCIEQPGEPKPFCGKIRIASYPTREHVGLVFASLGEGAPPPFPECPEHDEAVAGAVMLSHPCNYFQRAENNIDGIHVRFAHGRAPGLGQSVRGRAMPSRISARETAWGVTQLIEYEGVQPEQNHFLMPNSSWFSWQYGSTSLRIHNRLWYVPIDDENHNLFVVTLVKDEGLRRLLAASIANMSSAALQAAVADVLAGRASFAGLDAERPDLILVQDAIVTCGLGTIANRHEEHLGRTDVAVSLLRRLWRRELRALAAGMPLTEFSSAPLELLRLT
jgi:5,5'-dehydrodivanillate O-demethylase